VPPDAATRARRERLTTFIRERGPGFKEEVRRALGWDDESLARLVDAEVLVHSSPHVSMNAFAPMFAYPWACRTIGTAACAKAVHLRTQLTHNNVSDGRWRPYAWWHRGRAGEIRRTALFSRHSHKRRVLLAEPVPAIDPDECDPGDAAMVALAAQAGSYAWFCLVYRSLVERRAGLDWPGRIVEVPSDLLSAFVLQEEGDEAFRVGERLGLPLRAVGADGELHEVRAGDEAAPRAQCPIPVLMAEVYRLGAGVVVGAEKMAQYLPAMNRTIGRIFELREEEPPSFPPLVSLMRFPAGEVMRLDPASAKRLAASGGAPSLPIGAADHGLEVARRLDALLSRPWSEFSSQEPERKEEVAHAGVV
jgi:hypothetical protein